MAFRFPHVETRSGSRCSRSFDDAEKGQHQHDIPGIYLASLGQAHVSNPSIDSGLPSAANTPNRGSNLWSANQSTVSFKSDSPLHNKPEQKISPPPKKKVSRYILFTLWFNTYKKLFTIVIILNLVGMILTSVGEFPYAQNHLGAMVLGNLLFAILMRNELFFRILYMAAIYGLRSWAPIRIKLAVASFLQHVGGVHSGCAISGTAWLVYFVIQIFPHQKHHLDVLISGIVTCVFIIISVLSAVPWVRNNYHNVFEKFHRFAGWMGLAATWVFVVLSSSYDVATGKRISDTDSLITTENVWFTIFMTILICLPWVTMRRVAVEVEIPSPKVAVLRFNRGMQQGLLGRISRTPFMEYHAFGIISEGRKSPYHYMVCGAQGDFTKGLVENPPRYLWTRELKFAGIGHASAMFNRGIRVCTGTGIGAALSTCIQSKNWFLIWIGSDQEKTFGPTISRLIHDNIEPDRMILWDTIERGRRPDTMQLLRDTYSNFGAEVIFITSNMKGNDEMMQGCREEGMNAFGTLWDF
ncbi:non-ribosomal peptide synthetase [Fusarium beomiforme]|uniref:Non-ribosomal peptide synthetase n=1 Tax=Fusarium beomiforme TaxID=44412 RepID=A0A9P5AVH7_9HYPO|nr:non-ribosomal peptide synthetase [Fusarium beomiforme]